MPHATRNPYSRITRYSLHIRPMSAACSRLWWLRATHIRPTSTTPPRGSTTIPQAASVGNPGGNTTRPVLMPTSPSHPMTWIARSSYSSRSIPPGRSPALHHPRSTTALPRSRYATSRSESSAATR
jgi:hypothetical protein